MIDQHLIVLSPQTSHSDLAGTKVAVVYRRYASDEYSHDRNDSDLDILGKAKRRWVPTQEGYTSHAGGTTSGLCPSGALPPPYAFAIWAASCLSLAEARPSHQAGLAEA
jgi:hypothetical protein